MDDYLFGADARPNDVDVRFLVRSGRGNDWRQEVDPAKARCPFVRAQTGMRRRPIASSWSAAERSEMSSLRSYIEAHRIDPVKLHLGCGGVRWADFINVDLHPHDPSRPDGSRDSCTADAYADMRELGLLDDSVDEIFTSTRSTTSPGGRPSTCSASGTGCSSQAAC